MTKLNYIELQAQKYNKAQGIKNATLMVQAFLCFPLLCLFSEDVTCTLSNFLI